MIPQPLAPDAVHVWLAWADQIRDPQLLGRYRQLLSEEERDQHDRFVFDRDRHLYLVAHALVRCTLSRYFPRAPETWRFEATPEGRPELCRGECPQPLRFNLSHTHSVAACAVTLGSDLGVDVECVDRVTDTSSIAERFFSPSEVQALRALPAHAQTERFFSYWTLKESYIKARGLGLAIPLEHFSFDLEQPEDIRISFSPELADNPNEWQFALRRPSERHRLAVGIRTGAARPMQLSVASTVPLVD